MAQIPGAEAFGRMLQLHGVKHVFGLCGDTSLQLYDVLYRCRIDNPSKLRDALAAAAALGEPALVGVVCQPLQEARAPVSEWIA